MSEETAEPGPDFETVSQIIRLLEGLSEEQRARVLTTVSTWYQLGHAEPQTVYIQARGSRVHLQPLTRRPPKDDEPFVGRTEISPKDFILEKDPRTDVERMAALAYYLTHFRDNPHFKTNDLSRLNAEAAQRKFANAANTAKNATRDGFFVPAPKAGLRQLSAMGERYIQSLPDRDAANEVRKRMPGRRVKRNGSTAEFADRDRSREQPANAG